MSISSMEEFQKKYLPMLVGKVCPYCGLTNEEIEEVKKRRSEWKGCKK